MTPLLAAFALFMGVLILAALAADVLFGPDVDLAHELPLCRYCGVRHGDRIRHNVGWADRADR